MFMDVIRKKLHNVLAVISVLTRKVFQEHAIIPELMGNQYRALGYFTFGCSFLVKLSL